MRMAVGAGDHQPVQHAQVDGTLDVEGELDTNGSDSITGSSIINKGHIHTLGGTLTIDPTPFLNLGLFEVQSSVSMIYSVNDPLIQSPWH